MAHLTQHQWPPPLFACLAGLLLPGHPAVAFQNPPAADVPPLTLDEARARAVERNPQWLSVQESLRGAEAQVRQVEAGGRFQVSARSALYYDSQPPYVEVPPISLAPGAPPAFEGGTFEIGNPFNARLELIIERLLLGGGVRPNIQAARLALESARLRAERARQELVYSVDEAYLQAAAAADAVEVARENLRARQAQREVALGRFETGLSPRFDVVRAETDVAASEEQLSRYANDYDLALGRLALVTGDDLDRRYALTLPAPEEIKLPLDELVAEATEGRADLQALEQERRAALASGRAARAERQPTLGVRVEGRGNLPALPIDPSGVRLMVVGQWRLYDGGRSRGLEDEAEARARRLELEIRQREREAGLEVRNAYLSLQNARQRLRTAERQVEQAQEAREIARARYELGTGLAVEIAESEAALAEARFNRLQARVDSLRASARLQLALGGPPGPDDKQPSVGEGDRPQGQGRG